MGEAPELGRIAYVRFGDASECDRVTGAEWYVGTMI